MSEVLWAFERNGGFGLDLVCGSDGIKCVLRMPITGQFSLDGLLAVFIDAQSCLVDEQSHVVSAKVLASAAASRLHTHV